MRIIAVLMIVVVAAWDTTPQPPLSGPSTCVAAPLVPVMATDYYQIKLVGTRKVQGARMAKGVATVTFAPSPFGVALSAEGTYVVQLSLEMMNVDLGPDRSLVAWITTPQLDQVKLLGPMDQALKASGTSEWNKFLVVITAEPNAKDLGSTWTGPIVARGMSRSGLMHTMAGHGPFETEPCAVYGF